MKFVSILKPDSELSESARALRGSLAVAIDLRAARLYDAPETSDEAVQHVADSTPAPEAGQIHDDFFIDTTGISDSVKEESSEDTVDIEQEEDLRKRKRAGGASGEGKARRNK